MASKLPSGWTDESFERMRTATCEACGVHQLTTRAGVRKPAMVRCGNDHTPAEAELLARRLTEAAAIARQWDAE